MRKVPTQHERTLVAVFFNCTCVYHIDINKCYIISYRGLLHVYRDMSIYRYIVGALSQIYMYMPQIIFINIKLYYIIDN